MCGIYLTANQLVFMPKKKKKKVVVEKKLIGFTQEMLDELERKKKAFDTDEQTEVFRRLLTGEQQFMPSIEKYLEREQRAREISRDEMIQILLLEALKLRDSRFQLP